MSYAIKVKRVLSDRDLQELADKHLPKLTTLSDRYLPGIEVSLGMRHVEFLDAMRGQWLLDQAADRPPHEDVVSGVGFALGSLLRERFGMHWCLIEDNHGDDLSMIKFQDGSKMRHWEISILPFNYVAKREKVQNVEVFCDGMKEFEKMLKAERE